MSKLYFRVKRSVMGSAFTNEMLATLCQDCRKILRWPLVKLVSKVSPAGIAPPRSPGWSNGRGVGPGIAGDGFASGNHRDDGIGDAIVDAIEDAAHRAGVVDDAVGLSALQHSAAVKAPSVGHFALQRGGGKELRQFIVVAEVEDVGAVEIGGAVGRAEIQRIVAVEEQAHAALLVERVGISVGKSYLQAVAHAFLEVSLQGVVGGNSGGRVALRFRRIAQVGDAQVDVAALVVDHHRLRVRQVDWAERGATRGLLHGVAVGV